MESACLTQWKMSKVVDFPKFLSPLNYIFSLCDIWSHDTAIYPSEKQALLQDSKGKNSAVLGL